MTFARWCMNFRADPSPFGDVARDLVADPRIVTRMTYPAVRARMVEMGACDRALVVLEEMRALYLATAE